MMKYLLAWKIIASREIVRKFAKILFLEVFCFWHGHMEGLQNLEVFVLRNILPVSCKWLPVILFIELNHSVLLSILYTINYLPFYFCLFHPCCQCMAKLRLGETRGNTNEACVWANYRQVKTIYKCRRSKTTWGKNNPVYNT